MVDTRAQYLAQAREVIRDAEKSLRALVARAATEGDYEAIGKITQCAREVSATLDRVGEGDGQSLVKPGPARENGTYPKFFKSTDNKLIMLGWSRKGQKEYEHRAPRNIMDQLVSVLLRDASAGGPMAIDKILPRLKAEDGSVAPEYYARTFLRWFRARGLVRKFGHQGYSVVRSSTFSADVSALWKSLPTR